MEISHIVYNSENDPSSSLKYEASNLRIEITELACSKLAELKEKLPDEIPKSTHDRIIMMLGNALHSALVAEDIESSLKSFESVESRINRLKTPFELKAIFISSSALITLIICLIGLSLYLISEASYKNFFICCSCGSVGTLFSLLQRNSELLFSLTAKLKYILLQSFLTCILGSISGGLLYILSKSEIAFSFASNNTYSLAILAVVAGFSERMIPEMFKSIEKDS